MRVEIVEFHPLQIRLYSDNDVEARILREVKKESVITVIDPGHGDRIGICAEIRIDNKGVAKS